MSKKKTYYFQHDCNAREDDKIIALRMDKGVAGYGIYFLLLEFLSTAPDCMFERNYNKIGFILHIGSDEIKAVVENYGLFQFTDDGKRFYSVRLKEHMDAMMELSEARSKVGKLGGRPPKDEKKTSEKPIGFEKKPIGFKIETKTKAKGSLLKTKEDNIREDKSIEDNAVSSLRSETASDDARDAHAHMLTHESTTAYAQTTPPPPSSLAIQPVTTLVAATLDDINNHASWVDNAARLYNLSPPALTAFLNTFADKLAVDGITHKSLADFRRHFNNWLRIQITAAATTNNKPTNANTRKSVARPSGNYETDF